MYEWLIEWRAGAQRGTISASGFDTKAEALADGLEYARRMQVRVEYSIMAQRVGQ